MQIDLLKFEEKDFNCYFALVSNEAVMAQITERSIPFEEGQLDFKKIIRT